VPLAAITRRGAVPVWPRASWSCPAVAAKVACQPATRRRREGLVGEPVAEPVTGNAAADMRSLPAGLGRTQRPVDRGAGGNRRQSALPCGARRLPPTRPVLARPARCGGPSLHRQGRSRPPPHLRHRAAPQLHPTVTAAGGEASHPARSHGVSWRTAAPVDSTTVVRAPLVAKQRCAGPDRRPTRHPPFVQLSSEGPGT
jgi:hypothetical protein